MSLTEPSISIITATFNSEKVLPVLIESLRSQTDKNFEWIVIDGGSFDSTIKILKSSPDVVAKCVSESDFGIYDALNKGIVMSESEYYIVVGSDDVLDPEAVANFRSAANASNADIIAASVSFGGQIQLPERGPSWLYGQFAFVAAHAVGTMFRKNLHDRFGYYSKKYPIAADALFIKTACMNGATRHVSPFVAGVFGLDGVRSTDLIGSMSEFFRVQFQTENRFVQLLLYILRLIKNYPRL